jgi:hypothetical protein
MIDDSLIINTFVLFFLNNKHICVIGSNYRHTPYVILYYIYLSLSPKALILNFLQLTLFFLKERTPFIFDTKYFYVKIYFFQPLSIYL